MSTPEGGPHTLDVEIVTPDGSVLRDRARMIVVPGAEGELGVLPRHAPLIAELNPGETRVRLAAERVPVPALRDRCRATSRCRATRQSYWSTRRCRSSRSTSPRRSMRATRREAAIERLSGDEEQVGRLRSAQRDLAVAENQLKVAGRA